MTMRAFHPLILLVAGIVIIPQLTWSQGPNNAQNKAKVDPEQFFNRLANGGELIVVADVTDPMLRGMLEQQFGTDQITREQFMLVQGGPGRFGGGGGGNFGKGGQWT